MKQFRIMLVVMLVLLAFASTSFAAVNNKYFRADKQYFDIDHDIAADNVLTGFNVKVLLVGPEIFVVDCSIAG